MPLRQTTGFVQSLLRLVGLAWSAPDFSTLYRRQKTLNVSLPYRESKGPLNLLIDSTGMGISAFYQRIIAMNFKAADLGEIIRLGLIGAGMHPQLAMQLVQTYAHNRPLSEVSPLALDILIARWEGTAAPATREDTE